MPKIIIYKVILKNNLFRTISNIDINSEQLFFKIAKKVKIYIEKFLKLTYNDRIF